MSGGIADESPPDPSRLGARATGAKWIREHTTASIGILLAAAMLFAFRSLLGYDPASSRPVTGGTEGFLFEPTGGSPVLIFSVSAWMLWNRRHLLAAALGSPASIGSPAALVAGLGFAFWAVHTSAVDLLIPSMSLLLLGGAGFLAGAAGMRTVRLPALFLLFAVPVPPVLVNAIIWPLQIFTAKASMLALGALQIDAQRSGDMIFTLDRAFHVIESCAGLRVMITLSFSSIIYAELFRRSRAQMLMLLLSAPFIGALVNVVRVLTIIFNPYSALAEVHTAQGIAMIIVAVLVLAGVDRMLLIPMGDRAYATPPRPAGPDAAGVGRCMGRLATVTTLLLAIGGASLFVPEWRPTRFSAPSIYRIPVQLGAWTAAALAVDKQFLGSVSFTERISRAYRSEDGVVDLFVGLNRRLEREGSMLSEKTTLPSGGWEILESGTLALAPDGREASFAIIRSRGGRALTVQWYEGMASVAVETARSLLAFDHSPLHRPGHALLVRAATPLGRGLTARKNALARIESLLSEVRRVLDENGLASSAAPRS